MEFGLSQEQVLLQDSINRYLRDNASLDRVRQFADGDEGRATDLETGLAELGINGLLVPENYGGVGLSPLDACIVAESLGHAVAPVAFVANAIMVPVALTLAGSDGQKSEWLGKISGGETVVGAAVSELAGARLDAGVTATNGKLNGKSMFVLDYEADAYLVADRDCGLHLVDANAGGLKRQRLETVERTRPIGQLDFDNVAAESLPGASAAVCARMLDFGRVMLAADTLGAGQNMIDQAVAYAMQREQFNRVIASFQAVKHMCAQMAADLEPCRALVWYAGHALGELPDEAHLVALHAKAHLSEVGQSVAKTATEVHGGMGFTDLVGLHYWFKRIGFNRQVLGAPERLREQAARVQGFAA